MSFIPRPIKPPVRRPLTCRLTVHTATLLQCYAEYVDGSREDVIEEALRVAFRRDRDFQLWMVSAHPDIPLAEPYGVLPSGDSRAMTALPRPAPTRPTPTAASRPDARTERSAS